MALVLLINKRSTVLLTEGIHVLYIHTVHTHASVYIKIETFHFVLHVSYAPDLSVFAVLGVFVGLLLYINAIHGETHHLCGKDGKEEDERWSGHTP